MEVGTLADAYGSSSIWSVIGKHCRQLYVSKYIWIYLNSFAVASYTKVRININWTIALVVNKEPWTYLWNLVQPKGFFKWLIAFLTIRCQAKQTMHISHSPFRVYGSRFWIFYLIQNVIIGVGIPIIAVNRFYSYSRCNFVFSDKFFRTFSYITSLIAIRFPIIAARIY